jgi:hydrogenase maturation protein HypF
VSAGSRPSAVRRPDSPSQRVHFVVEGVVQGVGFRPFVHRLATELRLTGFVGNDAASVFIETQGPATAVAQFASRLRAEAPPMALIRSVRQAAVRPCREDGFRIVASEVVPGVRTLVSPDVATCAQCLAELFDPADRRYRHPFITCTNCGPRFTIIHDLPYDRLSTTMAGFAMCAACADEYADPADRRFHAQPIACPDCGPVLRFESGGVTSATGDAALAAAQRALAEGGVVAVKGIGGYHLACRPDHPGALALLRARKSRDEKPFALLVRDVDVARTLAHLSADEEQVLTGPARPIVLLHRRVDAPVDEAVAPGNPLLGVMLAYTPVHHLLLARVPGSGVPAPDVLVMTSANVSDEPLCFDDVDAGSRLPLLADAVLTHDRLIHVPCDDSVVRVVDGAELPIRRSRGYAPLPVSLGRALPATLAVGGELKNTCCLVDGANAFCSAHVGDMGSVETIRAFERAVEQLSTLHRIEPEIVAADAHPAYLTREWAERHTGGNDEPDLFLVQHHHAHVVSLLAEQDRVGSVVLGVAFDGTGYGADRTVWGGEFLLVGPDPSSCRRLGHLRTVPLPGGDAAVRNPCRMALAYLDASGIAWDPDLPPVAACTDAERAAVRAQLRASTGSVACSSMGRFFDAVAALLGVRQRIGYEAQAAIELEILAGTGRTDQPPPWRFAITDGVLDYAPVVSGLARGLRAGIAPATLAYWFHVCVADAVARAAADMLVGRPQPIVGLTGGVFQNVLLLRACRSALTALDLDVLVHRRVPPNDAGLALGQAVIAAAHRTAQPPQQEGAIDDRELARCPP